MWRRSREVDVAVESTVDVVCDASDFVVVQVIN